MTSAKNKQLLTTLGGVMVICSLILGGQYFFQQGHHDMGRTVKEQTAYADFQHLVSRTVLWARGLMVAQSDGRVSGHIKVEWQNIERDYHAIHSRLSLPIEVTIQFEELVKIIKMDLITALEAHAGRELLAQIDELIVRKRDRLEIFLRRSPDTDNWGPQTSEIYLGLAGGFFVLGLLLIFYFSRNILLFSSEEQELSERQKRTLLIERELKRITEQTNQALNEMIHRTKTLKVLTDQPVSAEPKAPEFNDRPGPQSLF
jgi:hypothetical protein